MLAAACDDGRPHHHRPQHQQGVLRRYGLLLLLFFSSIVQSCSRMQFVLPPARLVFHLAVQQWQYLGLFTGSSHPADLKQMARSWIQLLVSMFITGQS